VEEVRDLLGERCAAGDTEAQPAAEAVLDLRVDEPVGNAVLQRQSAGNRLAALAQHAHAPPHVERPVEQPPPRPVDLLELRQHRRVHLLEEPRHARQQRRPHRRHRLGDAQRIGAEGGREALVRSQQVHQPAEVVRQREVEQHHVVAERELRHAVDARGHLVVVAVADHAGLRWAGRARRVDEGENVLLADLSLGLGQGVRVGRGELAAAGT
jgi:hypothetical protein